MIIAIILSISFGIIAFRIANKLPIIPLPKSGAISKADGRKFICRIYAILLLLNTALNIGNIHSGGDSAGKAIGAGIILFGFVFVSFIAATGKLVYTNEKITIPMLAIDAALYIGFVISIMFASIFWHNMLS